MMQKALHTAAVLVTTKLSSNKQANQVLYSPLATLSHSGF